MLRESVTSVIARNEKWRGTSSTEPIEAGWATEAVFFIRALDDPQGALPDVIAEISPDGMHWLPEGARMPMPTSRDAISVLRIAHFGNWLRLSAALPPDASAAVLVTVHLK